MKLLLVLLVACGASSTAPALENRTPTNNGPRCDRLTGKVFERSTNEAVDGVTIVATGGAAGEDITITDEHGDFVLVMTANRQTLTIYYGDVKETQQVPSSSCAVTFRIRTEGQRPTL